MRARSLGDGRPRRVRRRRRASRRTAADARGDAQDPPAAQEFNPRHTFDQFVIGDGNRLAHAAALAVAETPGQAYNPLFLHAPPGLGKTHLLNAIGNYISRFDPGTTVRYTTVEAFTNGFIAALTGSARPLQAASTATSTFS